MFDIWIEGPSGLAYYDSFKTREQAVLMRDEYNEWADETHAYIVQDRGD